MWYADKDVLKTYNHKWNIISDFFVNSSDGLKSVLQSHLIDVKSQILMNAGDIVKNYEFFNKKKLLMMQQFMYYYKKDLLEY